MKETNRRDFLKLGASAFAGTVLFKFSEESVFSANQDEPPLIGTIHIVTLDDGVIHDVLANQSSLFYDQLTEIYAVLGKFISENELNVETTEVFLPGRDTNGSIEVSLGQGRLFALLTLNGTYAAKGERILTSLFYSPKSSGDGWDTLTSDNKALAQQIYGLSPPENLILYQVPDPTAGNLLAFYQYTQNTEPLRVAIGRPNREISAVDWEQLAVQIPVEELGDFTSGIRFVLDGKIWEFVSSIPGVTFDAQTTDVEFFSKQLRIFRDDDPSITYYVVPSTHTIRVEMLHDNSLGQVATINNVWGLSIPSFETEGVFAAKIPFADQLLDRLNDALIYQSDIDRSIEIVSIIFLQIYWGGRMAHHIGNMLRVDPYEPMFELLGLPKQPTGEQSQKVFRGLGIIFDRAVYPSG